MKVQIHDKRSTGSYPRHISTEFATAGQDAVAMVAFLAFYHRGN